MREALGEATREESDWSGAVCSVPGRLVVGGGGGGDGSRGGCPVAGPRGGGVSDSVCVTRVWLYQLASDSGGLANSRKGARSHSPWGPRPPAGSAD